MTPTRRELLVRGAGKLIRPPKSNKGTPKGRFLRVQDLIARSDRVDTQPAVDDSIPIANLIVLEACLNNMPVRVLKDDRCNTNVISREFFESHADCFDVAERRVEVSHSKKGNTETATKVVLNARLICGEHVYNSNFAIANCRYNVLLGMPWHVSCKPKIRHEVPGGVRNSAYLWKAMDIAYLPS